MLNYLNFIHYLNSNVIFINLQNKDFSEDLSKIENEFGILVHNFDDLDHFDNIDDVETFVLL